MLKQLTHQFDPRLYALRNFLLVLFCCGVLAACKEKPDVQKLQQQASAASAAGDHAAALIHYKSLLQLDPKNLQLRLQVGREHLENAQPDIAEREFRRAFELGATQDEIQPLVSRALFEQRRYDKLLEESEPLLQAGKLDAVSLTYRGMALLGQAKVDAAQAMFERALQKIPALPIARLGQARVTFAKGQMETALTQVNSILAEQPTRVEALATRADMALVLNRREQAITDYQALIAVQPRNTSTYARLVTLLCEAQRFDEADRAIHTLSKSSPPNGLVDYLDALVLFHKKDLPNARKKLVASNRELPNFVPAHVLSGRIELADHQPAQAIKTLATAVRLESGHLQARMLLADALLQENQPQQAFETLRPVLNAGVNSAMLYERAGMALLQSNEPRLAEQYLAYASKLAPDATRIQSALELSRLVAQWGASDHVTMDQPNDPHLQFPYRVLEITRALGENQPAQWTQAEKLALRLVTDYPKQALAHNLLGTIYAKQNRLAQARGAFEHALELEPEHAPALINLAQLALNQERRAEAFSQIDRALQKQPDSLALLLGRAEIGRRAGESSEQISQWLEKAQQIHPNLLKPAVLAARHYLDFGDPSRALKTAQRAQKIAPNDAETAEILGHSMAAVGDRAGALTAYARLVTLRPNEAMPLLFLARAQSADGKTASAVQNLQKALQLKPSLLEARIELILLYARLGQKNEAERQLAALKAARGDKAMPALVAEVEADMALVGQQPLQAVALYRNLFERQPSSEILRKLHRALLAAGRTDEAFSFTQAWFKRYPNDLKNLLFMAVSAEQQHQPKIAVQFYAAALKLKPDDVTILNNLAAATTLFDPAHAVTLAQQARQSAPDDPMLMDTLGWAMVAQGQAATGLKLIDQASRKAPENLSIAYHHAVALLRAGDSVAARMRIDEVLGKNQRFAEEEEAKSFRNQLGRP